LRDVSSPQAQLVVAAVATAPVEAFGYITPNTNLVAFRSEHKRRHKMMRTSISEVKEYFLRLRIY
jgi:hypothetical protein